MMKMAPKSHENSCYLTEKKTLLQSHCWIRELLQADTICENTKHQHIKSEPEIKETINPLTPRSDQYVSSPYDIPAFSHKQVMWVLKVIK